jgi:hypothetical protein
MQQAPAQLAFDTTGSGSLIIAGGFYEKGQFGSITLTTTKGDTDAYVAKADLSGNFLWAKAIATNGDRSNGGPSAVLDVTVDNGDIYATGYYYGKSKFGAITLPGPDTSYRGHRYIAKLDTSGNFQWAQAALDLQMDSWYRTWDPDRIAVSSSGSVFLSGHFSGAWDFGGEILQSVLYADGGASPDGFVSELNSTSGQFVRTWRIGGPHYDFIASGGVTSDAAGGVLVTGNVGSSPVSVNLPDGSTYISNLSGMTVLRFSPPPPTPPTIASLSDSPDPVVQGGTLTLTASGVADIDGTVARVGFYLDVDGNGELDELIDQLLASDSSAAGGWSAAVNASFALGSQTYFAVALDNTGLASQPASTTGQVVSAPPGNVNDMYVWDLGVEQRLKANKQEARFSVVIRRDSDANGSASGTDALVANAAVTLAVRNRTTNALIATISGTTNSSGVFTSGWISNLAAGEYFVEVTALAHAVYSWNGSLDPTSNDGDVDNDGLPDQMFTVS